MAEKDCCLGLVRRQHPTSSVLDRAPIRPGFVVAAGGFPSQHPRHGHLGSGVGSVPPSRPVSVSGVPRPEVKNHHCLPVFPVLHG